MSSFIVFHRQVLRVEFDFDLLFGTHDKKVGNHGKYLLKIEGYVVSLPER